MAFTKNRLARIFLASSFNALLLGNSVALGAPVATTPGTAVGEEGTAYQSEFRDPIAANRSTLAQGVSSDAATYTHADPAPYIEQLENNTRQILLKIVELERYNLKYRSTVAKQGRWKGWRYLFSQETNSAVSMSGFIVGTYERTHVWHYKDQKSVKENLNRNVLEAGNVLGFVAQVIGAGGSAVEFGINGMHEVQTHMKGFSPAAARKKVKGICTDIRNLLAEREKLEMTMNANCGPTKYSAVSHAEEPVLEDMRDISISEFKQFHSSARRLYAFQQTLYLTDIARNVLGAFGNRFGWDALRTGDRHNNTRAGVFFVLSGGLTVLNPISSRAVGKVVGEYHKHYIKTCTEGTKPGDVEKLNQDIANLTKIANAPDLQSMDLPVLRCADYSDHTTGVRNQLHLASRELRAGVLTASENLISGTLIGGAKTAGGIMFLICGSRFPHNGRITNYYLGTGNIIGLAWTPYAILETLRIQVKREIDIHRLSKKHELPGQIIKDRLAKLDALEEHLLKKNYHGTGPSTSMQRFEEQSLPLISSVMPPDIPDFSNLAEGVDELNMDRAKTSKLSVSSDDTSRFTPPTPLDTVNRVSEQTAVTGALRMNDDVSPSNESASSPAGIRDLAEASCSAGKEGESKTLPIEGSSLTEAVSQIEQ